jgi:protein-serine/threonine kinase
MALTRPLSDYENQRLQLLHKHGIDIGDSVSDGKKAKRMTSREIEQLMGGGDGRSGLFTWRDKHRRKVSVNFASIDLLET